MFWIVQKVYYYIDTVYFYLIFLNFIYWLEVFLFTD